MSGDWMKVEVALPDKPEVWQIAGILRIDPDAVVGKLFKVWRWFDTHTESGNAHGVSYALVDSIVGVSGFAEAMALCGWLVQDGTILSLPNFDYHNGKTAKNRALTAKRVAKHAVKTNAPTNGASVSSALPREEKRREEEKQKKPAQARTPAIGLQAFIAECKAAGEEAIPANDAVYAYAERIGLPFDYVALAWAWFKVRYADKTQAGVRGWRQTFRNAVEGNWPKYWYAEDAGGWGLTTAGKQARAAQ